MRDAKQTAFINQWEVVRIHDGSQCLIGHVSSHPNQSQFHSHVQQTSRLVSIDEEAKIAETENTIYTLGDKLPQ